MQDHELDALTNLLGDVRTGDEITDLLAALRESKRRRERNSLDGGTMIAALHTRGWSYRQIGDAIGMSHVTVHRWGAPPQDESEVFDEPDDGDVSGSA
jgi:transcriptional regulator of acetoin/glycerol metabolism